MHIEIENGNRHRKRKIWEVIPQDANFWFCLGPLMTGDVKIYKILFLSSRIWLIHFQSSVQMLGPQRDVSWPPYHSGTSQHPQHPLPHIHTILGLIALFYYLHGASMKFFDFIVHFSWNINSMRTGFQRYFVWLYPQLLEQPIIMLNKYLWTNEEAPTSIWVLLPWP